MTTNIKIALVIIATFALSSCGQNTATDTQQQDHTGHDHAAGETQAADHSEDEVILTPIQIKTIGIRLGTFTDLPMKDYIRATGTLDVPPNETAAVHAPETGFVRNLKKFVDGSPIKKGELIATLEHPLYIQKQQEYLELQSEMIFINQELERQRALSEANASALKSYQKTQSEYAVKQVQMKGIAQYLTFLGINLERLKGGEITQAIRLTAPMSGTVMSATMRSGMLVTPDMELMTIIGIDHIHLELNVFESDIARVAVGQPLTFTMSNDPTTVYNGKVYLISPSFDAEKKTVGLHGHITGKMPRFIRGAFLEAKIWAAEAPVPCLPEGSVVSAEGTDYIFVQKQTDETTRSVTFERFPVQIKQTEGGWQAVQLLKTLPQGAKIVTKGAFYLISEMNKGEHHH